MSIFSCFSCSAPRIPKLRLHVDANRDGDADRSTKNLNRWEWGKKKKGAIILCNNDDGCIGALQEVLVKRLEAQLARKVIQGDSDVMINQAEGEVNLLHGDVHADGCRVVLAELVGDVSPDEAGFTHLLRSNDRHFYAKIFDVPFHWACLFIGF